MFIQLSGDDRSIRHDSVYLEIGRCLAAVARGMSIHDLECSSTSSDGGRVRRRHARLEQQLERRSDLEPVGQVAASRGS